MIDLLDFVKDAVVPSKFEDATTRKGQLMADHEAYNVFLDKLRYSHNNEIMVNPALVRGIEVDYDRCNIWVKTALASQ